MAHEHTRDRRLELIEDLVRLVARLRASAAAAVERAFGGRLPRLGSFDGDAQLEPGRVDLGLKRVLDPDDRMVAEGLRPARCEFRGHSTARVLDVAQELRRASELLTHRRQRVAVGLVTVQAGC